MSARFPAVLFVLVILALTASVSATTPRPAEAAQIAPGSIEFSPTVSFSHSNFKREGYGNVDTFTELNATPLVGFCVSDHFEVNGGVLVRHQSTNGDSQTGFGATAGVTYNFSRQGNLIPFGSVGFGSLFYDGFTLNNTAVLFPTISAGARVLVGSSASVNMSLGYQHESNANGEFNASANRLLASVGVSLFPWQKG